MSVVFKRRLKKFLLGLEIVAILVLGAGLGVAMGTYYQINKVLPPDAALDAYRAPVGTKIVSSDGVLLAKLAAEYREPIKLVDINKNMRDAIVAIEDARFYSHSGLDYRGLARAVWTNLQGGEASQGGSTITQQLARNMFLSQKKKLSRKIKEMLIAVQIERNWTKEQILEAYLNQVYFGSGAYGVKAAAQTYFGKAVKDLSLDEAAMIAGLVQRPSEFSPFAVYRKYENYDATRARRDDVLRRMYELGFIDQKRYEIARARPIKVQRERPRTTGYFKAKYFVQHVVDELHRAGYTDELIDKAGLTVVTTLNWKIQQVAEEVAKTELEKMRNRVRTSELAMVCVDPHTGYIRAMVGGVNEPWEKYQFNCATQAYRQPGSTFKLFVYAAAMEEGDGPWSSIAAQAIPIRLGNGKFYSPKGGRTKGAVSYQSAFSASLNGAAVNVGMRVGPRKVAALAKRFGLKGDIRAVPSLALGTSEATPLEMASAFGVFAANGKHAEPLAIVEVRDQDGKIQDEFRPKITDLHLRPETIEGMRQLTRSVVAGGTGRAASSVPEARGKTGTTEDHGDAWFVGYTPELATAVWTGNRDNSKMRYGAYGGQLCAPIWARFMSRAVELNPDKKPHLFEKKPEPQVRRPRRRPAEEPVTSDGTDRNRLRMSICPESGLLAGANCPARVMEEFMLGEQPLARCTIHGSGRDRPRAEDTEKKPARDPNSEDKPAEERPTTTPPTDPPPPDQ